METTQVSTSLRLAMNVDRIEVLRKLTLQVNKENKANGNTDVLILAVDHVFRAGKYAETGSDSDFNVWVVCHRPAEERSLTDVFREKNTPGHKRTTLIHWFEWVTLQYIPSHYSQENFLTWESMHPLDLLAQKL